MKDFADIPNASGTFPDVVAVDCSGPGETDGTAIIADTMTDFFGAIQALLNDRGLTPDDAAETESASQIYDAIRMAINRKEIIPVTRGFPAYNAGSHDWDIIRTYNQLESQQNFGEIRYALELPIGLTIDLTITVRVDPGAIRSGTNRMSVGLYYVEYDDVTWNAIESLVYDNGTTATAQDIVVTSSSLTVAENRDYFIILTAGSTGGSSKDYFHGMKVEYTLS